jgi:predicted SprT family Zn-dependent metalloprotease
MITVENYKVFDDAYKFFNEKLFNNLLPECLITFQKGKISNLGYFHHDIFTSRNTEDKISELALNPNNFSDRTDEEILSTLVHEMCHAWQSTVEEDPPPKYHDKTWASKMELLGLIPSNTGEEGGKKTGIQMTHYIDPNGKFIQYAKEFLENNKLQWNGKKDVKVLKKKRKKNKFKFICPECGQTIWGKEDAEILCGKCQVELEIEENDT